MADTELTGYWKGVGVSRTLQTVVHVYLEQSGSELSGRLEAPELPSGNKKGEVTGSVDGKRVRMRSREGIELLGEVAGQTRADQIIHGVMQSAEEKRAEGTLTLFRREGGRFSTVMYRM